jgi:hypothetical protein
MCRSSWAQGLRRLVQQGPSSLQQPLSCSLGPYNPKVISAKLYFLKINISIFEIKDTDVDFSVGKMTSKVKSRRQESVTTSWLNGWSQNIIKNSVGLSRGAGQGQPQA